MPGGLACWLPPRLGSSTGAPEPAAGAALGGYPPQAQRSPAGWPASGWLPARRRACCCRLPPRHPWGMDEEGRRVSRSAAWAQQGHCGAARSAPRDVTTARMPGAGTAGERGQRGGRCCLQADAVRSAARPGFGRSAVHGRQRSPDVGRHKVALPVWPLKGADQLGICRGRG